MGGSSSGSLRTTRLRSSTAVSAASFTSTAAPRGDKLSAGDAEVLFIFIRLGRGGNCLYALPARLSLMTDNRIYQSIESPKEWGETAASSPSPALEILPRPQVYINSRT